MLKLELTAHNEEYFVAAHNYTEQAVASIATQVFISVNLGKVANISGTIRVTGKSKLKTKTMRTLFQHSNIPIFHHSIVPSLYAVCIQHEMLIERIWLHRASCNPA